MLKISLPSIDVCSPKFHLQSKKTFTDWKMKIIKMKKIMSRTTPIQLTPIVCCQMIVRGESNITKC